MEITITKTAHAYCGRAGFIRTFDDSKDAGVRQAAAAFHGFSLSAQVARLSEDLKALKRRNRILLFLAIASPVISLVGFGWCVVIWAGKI